MSTREPTDHDWVLYRDRLCGWSSMTCVSKDELEQRGIALVIGALRAFGLRNLPTPEEFLEETATTLGTATYIPAKWSPRHKIITLGHEHEHAFQAFPDILEESRSIDEIIIDEAQSILLEQTWAKVIAGLPLAHTKLRPSWITFGARYLMSKVRRSVFESHAYAVGAEIHYAMTGEIQSLDHLEDTIAHGYALDADTIGDARLILESRLSELHATGVLRSGIARKAVEVLRGIDPELVTANFR